MGLRFRPVEGAFYTMLTDSARHLVGGAGLLAEMVTAGADREDVAARMREAEHAADERTHELIRKVNSTFVTPFDREDIYRLAAALDDVMDGIDDAVDRMLLYGVVDLPTGLTDQVDVIGRCAEVTAAAMPSLRGLRDLDEYWIEINRLENTGDRNHRRLLAHLFSGEYAPLEVLKLKDVVESLEDTIDAFERVANIVEQIVVKES
ncbi:DUF47 domain-containing protein [Nocardioides bruguierae]|uniref:DUF47 family protein n=1 Tax=Nocardioides bruguierae TaxID=2945102 RepID=A0A9X2D902_9ACTN|nr:DUF47 family protein [Nocardioides bruguierae]MCL8026223.1 DUF47 family protein [Nocardioides bruguierae]MCM0621568.1 DUF47 family protein [Nocardioides bruguierae]